MKVDSHIVSAINQYVDENKITYEDFAKQFHVSCASMTKWRRVGYGINSKNWDMLFLKIRKFLPEDRIFINDAGKEQYSSVAEKQSAYVFDPKYVPVMVPVFSITDMDNYDDTLESVTQFGVGLKAKTAEYRPKHKDKSSVFAIRISDDSTAPVLPKQTTLFVCAGERPQQSGMVVALPTDGKAMIGYYKRTGDKFEITPFNKDNEKVCGKVKDAKKLVAWIFPVLYYEVVTF